MRNIITVATNINISHITLLPFFPSLYKGPTQPGTHFQWPAITVGHKRPVPGVLGGTGTQIELETLTEPTAETNSPPRVFYVHNFLSADETDDLIRFSTSEENQYNMRPSTGGTHKAWNEGGSEARMTTRTSENAWDMQTQNAANIKQRAFRLLRLGGYKEALADGIQILRYELGQAYIAHHDYFPENQSDDYNWSPSKGGSNRFATVFLYLSDVEYGGQTVFPLIDKLTSEKSHELVERLGEAPSKELLKELVADAGLNENSWENKLIGKCYGKFAIPPRRGDAILFYSQKPDGVLDIYSSHGACPVLKGTKWGANLWVWNACRYSLCSDPLNPTKELPEEMTAPHAGGFSFQRIADINAAAIQT
jgi:prolyl 4-hydroxylase